MADEISSSARHSVTCSEPGQYLGLIEVGQQRVKRPCSSGRVHDLLEVCVKLPCRKGCRGTSVAVKDTAAQHWSSFGATLSGVVGAAMASDPPAPIASAAQPRQKPLQTRACFVQPCRHRLQNTAMSQQKGQQPCHHSAPPSLMRQARIPARIPARMPAGRRWKIQHCQWHQG